MYRTHRFYICSTPQDVIIYALNSVQVNQLYTRFTPPINTYLLSVRNCFLFPRLTIIERLPCFRLHVFVNFHFISTKAIFISLFMNPHLHRFTVSTSFQLIVSNLIRSLRAVHLQNIPISPQFHACFTYPSLLFTQLHLASLSHKFIHASLCQTPFQSTYT